MVGSFYDPELDEGCAFEELICFHGGLGGVQTRPFILHPAHLEVPPGPILGAASVHGILVGWRRGLQAGGDEPAERSGVEALERGVDVVAERQGDLRGALDDSRRAGHRRHRLEAGDDLVARRSGGEGQRDGVLERGRCCVDGDGRGKAHERRRSLIDARRCERPAVHRNLLEEGLVVHGEPPQALLVLVHW